MFNKEMYNKHILPEEMVKKAFIASNGELAWKREDLFEVINTYNNLDYPVEGLEIWIVKDNGQWDGLIPQKGSNVPGVYTWNASPRKVGENTKDYCLRTRSELFDTLEKFQVEKEVEEKYLPMIRYNLFVDISEK